MDTRLLVADGHTLVREGLVALLNDQRGFSVIAQAATGNETLDLVREHVPDIVVLDLRVVDCDSYETTAAINLEYPDVNVVAMAIVQHDASIDRITRAGACSYVLKSGDTYEFLEQLRRVVERRRVSANGVGSAAVNGRGSFRAARRHRSLTSKGTLTAREVAVMSILAEGKSNREIADSLGISVHTVHAHMKRLMAKLDVENRTQLAIRGVLQGIVSQSSAPPMTRIPVERVMPDA